MTPDDVLIAIGREVCAELAMYDRLHGLNALSEAGEQWRDALHLLVVEATGAKAAEGVQWEDIQP